MEVALIALGIALAAAITRLVCGIKLMTDYRVDEYLATPRARRLWLAGMALPLVMIACIIVAASTTHVWWVELAPYFLAAFVVWKTAWAIRMRLSGKYRDFYRSMQWQ